MQKYLAVFVISFMISTRYAESSRSRDISEKTLAELNADVIRYENNIRVYEEKIKNLECKMELHAKQLNNRIKNLQSKLQGNISFCTSATLTDFSKNEADLATCKKTESELITCRKEQQNTISELPDSCILDGDVRIKVNNTDAFRVRCDTKILEPGWLLVQQRVNFEVDFNRSWTDYKNGFGDSHNFFIGLEKLHRITKAQEHELYIQLTDKKNALHYARYDYFAIGDEQSKYAVVSLGKFNGDADFSLSVPTGYSPLKFSTFDQNNSAPHSNCASLTGGGWWFKNANCRQGHINGNILIDGWKIGEIYVKASHMMIRPRRR